MDKYEAINFTYYNPQNSIFKAGKSDRERITVYMCNNCENCEAFKRNKCVMLNGLYGHSCPYGKTYRDTGYTKSARKCGELILKNKEKYGNVEYSKSSLNFVCKIGDYIYLPLPHLNNYVNPIRQKDFFICGEDMIRKEDFTPEFIVELIKFKPHALMGGEITSYQKDYVPKFCSQLKRYMPDMFEKVKEIYPEISDMVNSVSYVGKKAKLKTLLPGAVRLSTDILEWNGKVLLASGKQISFWRLGDEKVVIYPNDNTYVEVVDDETITDDTIFEDE